MRKSGGKGQEERRGGEVREISDQENVENSASHSSLGSCSDL